MRKFWLILAATALVSCIPSRNSVPFEEGNNGGADASNNGSEDGGNNGTDMTANNGTDMTANNGTDMNVPDQSTPDMNMPDQNTPDMNMPDQNTPDMNMPDMCTPESSMAFCQRLGAECGMLTADDNCMMQRTENCGACTMGSCMNNLCDCNPESTMEFCQRLGAECGQLTDLDNCNRMRTENCGGCPGNALACNLQNTCVETDCADGMDNDNNGMTDCEDPSCLNINCAPQPNKVCQADGTCK